MHLIFIKMIKNTFYLILALLYMPGEESLLGKRTRCYQTRDFYFDCLDRNNEDKSKCRREYADFAEHCDASWVQHFIRKRGLEKYKKVVAMQEGKVTTIGDGDDDKPEQNHKQDNLKMQNTMNRASITLTNKTMVRELDQFYRENRPWEGIEHFASILQSPNNSIINEKLFILAARLIALFHAANSTDDAIQSKTLHNIKEILRQKAPQFSKLTRTSIEIILDCCDGNWDRIAELRAIPGNEDWLNLLAAIALRRKQIDKFSELCSQMNKKQKFYNEPNHPLWMNFLETIEADPNGMGTELMELLMEQLISSKAPITGEELEHVLEANKFGKWDLQRARIDRTTLECSICGGKLKPMEELDDQEYATLKTKFQNLFMQNSTKNIIANYQQIPEFFKFLDSLNGRTSLQTNDSGEKITTKPLVVDGLNVVSGHPSHVKFQNFRYIINALDGFDPILVITKLSFPTNFKKFGKKNILFYNIGTDEQSFTRRYSHNDDLFIIYSAFHLGPDAHILSNDKFMWLTDERENQLTEYRNLFKIWMNSRIIRFVPIDYEFYKNERIFKFPAPFLTMAQGNAHDGYHIVRRNPTTDQMPYQRHGIVYCVNVNKNS